VAHGRRKVSGSFWRAANQQAWPSAWLKGLVRSRLSSRDMAVLYAAYRWTENTVNTPNGSCLKPPVLFLKAFKESADISSHRHRVPRRILRTDYRKWLGSVRRDGRNRRLPPRSTGNKSPGKRT